METHLYLASIDRAGYANVHHQGSGGGPQESNVTAPLGEVACVRMEEGLGGRGGRRCAPERHPRGYYKKRSRQGWGRRNLYRCPTLSPQALSPGLSCPREAKRQRGAHPQEPDRCLSHHPSQLGSHIGVRHQHGQPPRIQAEEAWRACRAPYLPSRRTSSIMSLLAEPERREQRRRAR